MIAPPFFTEVTLVGYLVIRTLFDLHPSNQPLDLVKQDLVLPLIHPLTFVKSDLVHPLNHLLLTILTFKTPLGPFKRSKFPSEHLLLLRTPLFGTPR